MALKLIALIMMAACMAQSATIRNQGENVAALFVKDASSGQLRFLGAGLSNSQVNQRITNKQDFLEQFRPVDTNTDIPETIIDTETNTPTDTETDITNGGNAAGLNAVRIANRRRRVPNRRRRGNRRRHGNKNVKIYIIRPRN